ncbi:MAG: iron-sulfur cluster assembly scaffold protein [Promethearchaeota archaeon]|nr:MAG: iron-sulfur cluster assembly scaffold protein [Candidatus Lokiarchaeota archaeon]
MSKDFKEYVDKLQKRILTEDIEDHNEKIVNLFHNPINWGKPSKEDITISEERRGGPKNYFLGLYLKIEDEKITKANFITDGCGVMIATGCQTTILIENKSLDYAENLKSDDIEEALMGLPKEEKHCVLLAIETLKNLINKYKKKYTKYS